MIDFVILVILPKFWKKVAQLDQMIEDALYWKMPVLKMPLLEFDGTRKCWYWTMPVLECCHSIS